MCTAALAQAQATQALVFRFTGSEQTFTIPSGVSAVYVEAWGAGGGAGGASFPGQVFGGGGGGGGASSLIDSLGQTRILARGGQGGGGAVHISTWGVLARGAGADLRTSGSWSLLVPERPTGFLWAAAEAEVQLPPEAQVALAVGALAGLVAPHSAATEVEEVASSAFAVMARFSERTLFLQMVAAMLKTVKAEASEVLVVGLAKLDSLAA